MGREWPDPPRFPVSSVLVSFLTPLGDPDLVGSSWFCLDSGQPPRVTLSLQMLAPALKMGGDGFAVNLGPPGSPLALQNAAPLLWRVEEDGVPLIEGCPVSIICETVEQQSRYGHRLLIGWVKALSLDGNRCVPESPEALLRGIVG